MLRNATYMGYIGYNKSKTTNYIDKVRVKNLDEDSIQLVKGNFPPLISEELWHECDRIRKQKSRHISDAGRLHTPRRLSWSDASVDTKTALPLRRWV